MIIRKFGKYTGVHPNVIEALAQRAGAVWTHARSSQHSFSGAVVECFFADDFLSEKFQNRMQTLIHCPIQNRQGVLSVPCLYDTKLEIPDEVREKIEKNCYFGISGERGPRIEPQTLHALSDVIYSIRQGSRVQVGDCSGIDRAARRLLYLQNISSPRFNRIKVKVHRVTNKHNKREFVARSIRCIQAVGDGIWLSFPQSPCPENLVLSHTPKWQSSGSGTWSSLFFAASSGLPCLIFSPFPIPALPVHSFGKNWYSLTNL